MQQTSVFIVQDCTVSQARRRYCGQYEFLLTVETTFHTHIGTGSVMLHVPWRKEAFINGRDHVSHSYGNR